jgi:hypothetical protein
MTVQGRIPLSSEAHARLTALVKERLAGREGTYRRSYHEDSLVAHDVDGNELEGAKIYSRELDEVCQTRGQSREEWEAEIPWAQP